MILGIGTDIVDIRRIEKIIQKYENQFLNKNFHTLEIEKYNSLSNINQKSSFLAKRFAAKESLLKALGIGLGSGLKLSDIAIINNDLGAPKVLIFNDTIPNTSKYNIHTSLSDEKNFATAFVIIENKY